MKIRTTMWGGRFAQTSDPRLRRFNDSFAFDYRLLEEDVAASIGWAASLREAGVIDASEAETIVRGLRKVLADAGITEAEHRNVPPHAEHRNVPPQGLAIDEYEDVHSFVEAKLNEVIGPLARKLHTGRSRNDQVATDLRLWLMRAASEAREMVLVLAGTLAGIAEREAATPMPGYTHLKQAEPVTFGHWCLAYVEMLLRDVSRFESAMGRGNECPLGSGALAGTPLSIDRDALAKRLGFSRATASSLDAVSDRDFGAEYLLASSLLLLHLSRLAEDLIFFSTDEVGFVELPDAMATGSSRMPQKKNPDVLELVRGHAARSIGELTGLLALLKGLPLAYDKDLQLDKEPLFRTRDVLGLALPALGALLEGLTLHREGMRAAASSDLLLATQLMDAIAARGVAFREAHEIVSRRIGEAIAAKSTLRELGPSPEITASDLAALDVERALAGKSAFGGTAPVRVREAAAQALGRITSLRSKGDPR